MTRDEALDTLVEYQSWRQGANIPQPDPKLIGEALEEAIGVLSEKGDRPIYYRLVHITYRPPNDQYLREDYAWLAVDDDGCYVWTLSDNTTVIEDKDVIKWDEVQTVSWTYVDERLPNNNRKVLVKTEEDGILIGRYQLTHKGRWFVYGFSQSQMPKVICWKEICDWYGTIRDLREIRRDRESDV